MTSYQNSLTELNKDKVESFHSYFTYHDPNDVMNSHLVSTYKWNFEKAEREQVVFKISNNLSNNLTTRNGEINPGFANAFTNDKMLKATIRSEDEYEKDIIREWRILEDGHLQRIKVNKNGSNADDPLILENQVEYELKNQINVNKKAILDSMSIEEMQKILSTRLQKQRQRNTEEQVPQEFATNDNYN